MIYSGPNVYLTYTQPRAVDIQGNSARLDPGREAALITAIRNVGGHPITNLAAKLECSDSYITITDNWHYFGSLPVDSIIENTSDPYVVYVSPSCPQGHSIQFQLIAIEGNGTFFDTFRFNMVAGSYSYLVWNPDLTPSPGQTINSLLTSLSYNGNYTTNLLSMQPLDMYRAIFICCGMYSNNYRIAANGQEAMALVNYINNGGCVYMEGGDVWYYDPTYGGHNFCSLFGLSALADGTADLSQVSGFSGTFTSGMNFNYGGENSWVDHITPTAGFTIFQISTGAYNCGVAYNAGNYRTVGTSFELGGLIDASAPSTKRALLDSIMHFFGIFVQGNEEGIEENNLLSRTKVLKLYPNPFKSTDGLIIQLAPIASTKASLKIFNTTGSCVKTFSIGNSSQAKNLFWDGRDNSGTTLPTGVYFVNLDLDNKNIIKRVILVN